MVSWILGPGEKLLASQVGIGDSYLAAEELRKRHEEMEIKCTVGLWLTLFPVLLLYITGDNNFKTLSRYFIYF